MEGSPPAPTLGRRAERLSEELMGTYPRTGTVQTERHAQASATSSARDRPSQKRTMSDLLLSAGEQ